MGRAPGSLAVERSSWKRAVAKSTTWKVTGVLTLIVVSLGAGVTLKQVGAMTLAYHVITLFLYAFHERAWEKTTWGKS